MPRQSPRALAALLFIACGSHPPQSPFGSSSILEFRLVHPQPSSSSIPVEFESSLLHLDPQPVVSDRDIVSARPIEHPNQVILALELTTDAAVRMERVTSENIGSRMALLIDGQVISAADIQSAVAMPNVQVAVPRPIAEGVRLSARVEAKWPADPHL
jgi:preprotein translocase subunit SecD